MNYYSILGININLIQRKLRLFEAQTTIPPTPAYKSVQPKKQGILIIRIQGCQWSCKDFACAASCFHQIDKSQMTYEKRQSIKLLMQQYKKISSLFQVLNENLV